LILHPEWIEFFEAGAVMPAALHLLSFGFASSELPPGRLRGWVPAICPEPVKLRRYA
jgi:hypothetical protein